VIDPGQKALRAAEPFMWKCLPALILAAQFVSLVRAGVEPVVKIDLGGMRNVTADVTVSGDDYLVTVRMTAVRTFDPSTNARINRQKARGFALQALGKHLAARAAKTVAMSVSGAVVDDSGADGKAYRMILRVPEDGVKLSGKAKGGPTVDGPRNSKTRERVSVPSDLFSRKQEYIDTAQQLGDILSAEVESTRAEVIKSPPSDEFYDAVAEIEERGISGFEQLAAESQADKLLLRIEMEEVEKAIELEKKDLLELLRSVVKTVEENAKKEDVP
jgi:hypothetical protein